MAVGFKVKYYWYQVGTGDFLHSFFSTVCFNLEDRKWGSKYPNLMQDLYQGEVEVNGLEDLKTEVIDIKTNLTNFSPDKVVWNIGDLEKSPPWGENISETITDLSNYFVTSEGEKLIELLMNAIDKAIKLKCSLKIESL